MSTYQTWELMLVKCHRTKEINLPISIPDKINNKEKTPILNSNGPLFIHKIHQDKNQLATPFKAEANHSS
jgi:hypothetical protein